MRTVESLLSGPPRTLPRTVRIRAVREVMADERVDGLAIVDDHDHLVGIVTATDLLVAADDGELGHCMTRDVLTVSPHTSVVDAARTMHDHGIHHLVVIGHANEVVGVLSAFDLLEIIAPDNPSAPAAAADARHRAQAGDIVVVRGKAIDQRVRRGLITEVRGADGNPPYLVQWLDDPRAEPHDVLFFPGSDADIESPAPAS